MFSKGLTIAYTLLALLAAGPLRAEENRLDVDRGPGTFGVGGDLAEIELPEGFVLLDADRSKQLMEVLENDVTGQEVATLLPDAEDAGWFVVLEWDEMGWVDDRDADLDADAILESLRAGTDAANEARVEKGWKPMQVVGWHEPPHYDARTRNLTWAIVIESDGNRTINRMIKLLGRRGVMSATLVADSQGLDAAAAKTDELLLGYRFKPGSTYAEFLPGKDRLADAGLAAPVVGGGGAALVKSGLLARFWKFIVLGVLAAAGAARRLFRGERAEEQPVTRV